jgi:hypothetical protein
MSSTLSNVFLEAIGIGTLTLIIGRVIFYSGINKNKREEAEKYNKNLSLTLFLIGFLLHFMLEFGGVNKWYCDKKCAIGLKNLANI